MMLVAVTAIASCEKQSNKNEIEIDKNIFTLTASVPEMEVVKTDYDASGKFSWSAGDAISVLFNNGTTDKFFTLTTTESGATATFKGEVEDGYELGTIALFPASDNHTYDAGAISFYVQPEVDFTTSHFSANIPMLGSIEGESITFENIACTYKFIVKDLDNSVNKVKFSISNQTTYALSGSWPISTGSDPYINYNYASPGTENSCLAYTANAVNNQAVFYVSCRYWGNFQPKITIYDAETNAVLKEVVASASKQPTYKNKVQPISISAPGTGEPPFVPAITIDGDMSDWAGITTGVTSSASPGVYQEFKVTYDEQYLFFYTKRDNRDDIWAKGGYVYYDLDTDGDSTTGISKDGCPGLEAWMYLKPWGGSASAPEIISSPSGEGYPSSSVFSEVMCAGLNSTSYVETEMRIPRGNIPTITIGNTMKIYSWSNKDGYDVQSKPISLAIEK